MTTVLNKRSAPIKMNLQKLFKGADMRIQSMKQGYFDFSESSSLKVVEAYRQKYLGLSELLDANPRLLELAHHDWAKLLSYSNKGRRAKFSTEQLLRALIVKFIEQCSYRKTIVLIDISEFLRYFVRLELGRTMDITLLSRAFCYLSAEAVMAMNQVLNDYAVAKEKITGVKQRMDTTVYEANIHYPTDSSLLWDSFRTLARLIRCLQRELPELGLGHRFHDKKVKKLYTFIGRNISSNSQATQRKVKKLYRLLIQRVLWIHGVGESVLTCAKAAGYAVPDLSHYLPLVHRIVEQADKRVLQGIQVAADQKLYSLFEEHTELIKRGKAGKAIEFGHKVMLAQTGEKFIHHYEVMATRREDKDLLQPALDAHRALFGEYPKVLAADKGFYKNMKTLHALEKDIKTVSIAKKGRRTEAEVAREHSDEFREGQSFRAGVEGSISVLKRAFDLDRCLFKGFKNYAASVGLAILCHNLVLLTRL
ncbi:MAG: ISNCY family transposase [Phycisphaeraceae bacterium]|nr:ISNCY family transposase [Phycisphaeraceae bacterium]